MTAARDLLDGDTKPVTNLPDTPADDTGTTAETDVVDTPADADLQPPRVVFVAPDPAVLAEQRAEIEAQWQAKLDAAATPDALGVEGHLTLAGDLLRSRVADHVGAWDPETLGRASRALAAIDQALTFVPSSE